MVSGMVLVCSDNKPINQFLTGLWAFFIERWCYMKLLISRANEERPAHEREAEKTPATGIPSK